MAAFDLENIRKQCISSLIKCSENIGRYIEEGKDSYLNDLKQYLVEYCALEYQERVSNDALEKVKNDTSISNIDNLHKMFEENMTSMASKFDKPDKHPLIKQWNTRVTNMAARSIENIDEDLVATSALQEYIDPITKRPIVKPVRNKQCGHVYEKSSINEIIKQNKRMRCPVAGCGDKSFINSNTLEDDEELEYQISNNTS